MGGNEKSQSILTKLLVIFAVLRGTFLLLIFKIDGLWVGEVRVLTNEKHDSSCVCPENLIVCLLLHDFFFRKKNVDFKNCTQINRCRMVWGVVILTQIQNITIHLKFPVQHRSSILFAPFLGQKNNKTSQKCWGRKSIKWTITFFPPKICTYGFFTLHLRPRFFKGCSPPRLLLEYKTACI